MIEAKLIQAKLDLIYPIITYLSCKHFVAQWIMHPYSQSHLRGSNPDQYNKNFFLLVHATTVLMIDIFHYTSARPKL
jgi:hypothetical protein